MIGKADENYPNLRDAIQSAASDLNGESVPLAVVASVHGVCGVTRGGVDTPKSSEEVLDDAIVDSIFSSYRGRLGIPTDEEASVLKRFEQKYADDLEDLAQESQELIAKVQELCSVLDKTRQKIIEKKARSATCRALLAPIRTLPPEILAKIFRLAIPPSKKITLATPILVLCEVSKLWRDIIYHDPSLWNRFSLIVPSSIDIKQDLRVLQSVQYFVGKSGNVPLEISFHDTTGRHSRDGARHGSVLSYLIALFPRCRFLSLEISDTTMARYLATNQPIFNFQSLETLNLKFNPHLSFDSINSFTITSPTLRSVNLTVFHGHTEKISLPWQQLTTLSCTMSTKYVAETTVSAIRWLTLLAKCHKLENAEVYLQGKGATGRENLETVNLEAVFLSLLNQPLPSVALEHLKNLVVRVGCIGSLETLLAPYDLPVLESLRLDSVSQPFRLFKSGEEVGVKHSLGRRMNYLSGLVRLSLIRVAIEDDCLLALLKFTPRLVFLDILRGDFDLAPGRGYCPDDQILVDSLCCSTSSHNGLPLLPNLRDLQLYYTEWHDSTTADLQRYARLAISRYQWAVGKRPGGHGEQGSDDSVTDRTIPSYPFRLHLKFEFEDWEMKDVISEAIGPLHDTIFHPELAKRYFLKEGY